MHFLHAQNATNLHHQRVHQIPTPKGAPNTHQRVQNHVQNRLLDLRDLRDLYGLSLVVQEGLGCQKYTWKYTCFATFWDIWPGLKPKKWFFTPFWPSRTRGWDHQKGVFPPLGEGGTGAWVCVWPGRRPSQTRKLRVQHPVGGCGTTRGEHRVGIRGWGVPVPVQCTKDTHPIGQGSCTCTGYFHPPATIEA